MLALYQRHKARCKFKDDPISKQCAALFGSPARSLESRIENPLRPGIGKGAEKAKRDLERRRENEEQPKRITVQAALDAFVADCESRNLNFSTLDKYRRLRKKLVEFAGRYLIAHIGDSPWTTRASSEFPGISRRAPRRRRSSGCGHSSTSA